MLKKIASLISDKMIRCLVVLLLSSILFNLEAQDTIVLHSVEIIDSPLRKPAEASMERVLDTSLIKRLNTVTMSQLLIQHSPVFIKTYGPGGLATASFRGTTPSHTLVLWNNIPLNAPTLGQVDFSTIPVFMTDEIALQWGSRTASNSGGLGGTVNIENNGCYNEGLILDLKQTYGSFNTIGSYITTGYSADKCFVRLKAYRSSSDNDFKYNNIAIIPHQVMRQENADFVDYGVMPEFELKFKNSRLSVVSWNQWSDRNHPQIMPNVGNNNTDEYNENMFSRNVISYKYYWNTGRLMFKTACFYDSQHYFLQSYTSTGNPVTTINTNNEALSFFNMLDLEQSLPRQWNLYAKVQWDNDNVKSDNYDGMKSRNILSFYTAVDGRLFGNLNLRLTLRDDVVDGKNVGLFPTATLSYSFFNIKELTANIGYSHNYRNPSLNDLYWNPGGNPDLKPENGKTVDFNIKYKKKKNDLTLESQLGIYNSWVKDWIQWVPTTYRYWIPENVAEVQAYGLEFHAGATYKIGDFDFSLSGNYVFSHTADMSDRAEAQNTKGKQLIYIPKHHANAFFSARWKTWNIAYTMEFTGSRNTSMNDDEFFAFQLKPYMLHHLSFGKQINKFNMEMRLNNFTNEDYQAVLWRAMPGISLEVSLGFKL